MITVVGLGFVGLTTAVGFSEKGINVFGYDADKAKAGLIRRGKPPFYEPNLDAALDRNLRSNLRITESLKDAIDQSVVVFLCVGTPPKKDGSSDLSFLLKAIEQCLKEKNGKEFKVLVVKSTIPPSTAKEKIIPFIEKMGYKVGEDVGLVNNPEFLREGHAWDDFINPDRIVIGQFDEKSASIVENLYKSFQADVFKVSLNTAEFIKYLSNTMLSTLISFSNEMSMIADSVDDVDIKEAFRLLHLDRRWAGNPAAMASYVYPGCGFGGSCLPKDIKALKAQAKAKGHDSKFIGEVLSINSKIKEFVSKKVSENVSKDECVAVLGLAFKPDSDDVRDTPSKEIIEILLKKGYRNVIAYDPKANENFKRAFSLPIKYAETFDEVLENADAFLLLTSWDEFKKRKSDLANKKLLDFRYCL